MSDCKHATALRELPHLSIWRINGPEVAALLDAADHIDRLTRERDALRSIALRHAAELVRLRYNQHADAAAERIRSNRRVMLQAIDRDCEVQRLAGVALKAAIDKALAAEASK